jgi:anti-sigma regulatory factor (Ser/Thr protein kinase)
LPRREVFEPDSNVKIERLSQSLKQYSEIAATDEGIQIDRSEEQQANADLPRVESFEPGSNVTVERLRHERKQAIEIVSTDEGIQIDRTDEQ